MSLRVGVILSGCGYLDGTEITEAVSILLALDRRGAKTICMAPNANHPVTNHLNRHPTNEKRNVLVESARIARGKIVDITTITPDDLDALIFPGGFGAAKNLSTFATDGDKCKVIPDVERLITEMHAAKKPIGLACIAPCLAAAVLGRAHAHPKLTIGTDEPTAKALESLGASHHAVGPSEVYVDAENRLITTPCYMNDVGPWTVFTGAEKMVEQVLLLAGDPAAAIRAQTGVIRPHKEGVS